MSTEAKPKKVSAYPVANLVNRTDLLIITQSPGTANAATKAVTVDVFASALPVNGTPANSTINCISGSMFYDSNFVYIAVANNILKRVALQSF